MHEATLRAVFSGGELFTVVQNGHKRNRQMVDYTWQWAARARPASHLFQQVIVFDHALMRLPAYLLNVRKQTVDSPMKLAKSKVVLELARFIRFYKTRFRKVFHISIE